MIYKCFCNHGHVIPSHLPLSCSASPWVTSIWRSAGLQYLVCCAGGATSLVLVNGISRSMYMRKSCISFLRFYLWFHNTINSCSLLWRASMYLPSWQSFILPCKVMGKGKKREWLYTPLFLRKFFMEGFHESHSIFL